MEKEITLIWSKKNTLIEKQGGKIVNKTTKKQYLYFLKPTYADR